LNAFTYYVNQLGSYSELFKEKKPLEELIIETFNESKIKHIILKGNSGSGKTLFLKNLYYQLII
jgi:hypothetical protein